MKGTSMKRALLSMTFIFMLSHALPALPDKPNENSIGLQMGTLSSMVKDELASPLTYQGAGAFVQLSYRFGGRKNRHTICLSYSSQDLKPKTELSYGRHSLDSLQAGASYSYHRYVVSLFRDKLKVYLGGVWDNHFSMRKLYYIGNASETFGEVISSLDVSPLLEWPISPKCRLAYQLSFPLAAFVLRPPYAGKGVVTSNITAIGCNFWLKNRLELEHALSRRFWIRLAYSYAYYHYPKPQSVSSGADSYAAALVFVF